MNDHERATRPPLRPDVLQDTDRDRAGAFARLADDHLRVAYRLAAVLLGDPTEAQDAVQDAAVVAWQRFAELREVGRFEAWFDRILVNRCRDRLRRRRRLAFIPIETLPPPPADEGQPSIGEREALLWALDSLGPDQRTAVVLHYYADLTVDEIAARTGARPGTVRSRLHYGLEAMRAAYAAAERLPGGILDER